MQMIEALIDVEKTVLPSLLEPRDDDEQWHSLDINYRPPHVQRVWREVDREHRILLHMVHDCEPGTEFFHPHPWPSAVHAHTQYMMRSGAGPHDGPDPEVTLTQIIEAGSYYEMTRRESWHSVRVYGAKVGFSTMLIGNPWHVIPYGHLELGPVEQAQKRHILSLFRGIHGVR